MNEVGKEIYNKSYEEVFNDLNTTSIGLKSKQININKKKYGENLLKEKKKKNKAQVFLEQYKNLLVILLIVAAVISIFTGGIENTLVILFVITLNAVIATFQYSKTQKSIDSLKKLTREYQKVIRDGEEKNIAVSEVVVGDILLFSSGDIISCDCRLIKANNFEVDESSLTGEATSVEKSVEKIEGEKLLAERTNIVFRGSKVINGKAMAVCYAVGMNTEIGKIASLIDETDIVKSPLEKEIDRFSSHLAFIIVIICIIVFLINIFNHVKILDSLMFAIALAVAAIPEALFTILTIVLAIGTEKMAKDKAIVKDLKVVETLGCVNVIASDKTGTITENKMKVNKLLFNNNETLEIVNSESSYFTLGLCLCNDSNLLDINNDCIKTDAAILAFLLENKIDVIQFRNKFMRIDEIPFSSSRKIMSTVNMINGRKFLFTKGASEIILKKCTRINNNNIERKLMNNDIYKIKDTIDSFSKDGLRVLAIAYKNISFKERISEFDENELVFLGLVALSDPPKKGVKEAIEECNNLNIRPVMITGDHLGTALAISKLVGIKGKSFVGNIEANSILNNDLNIFSRVSPEDKITIVSKIQDEGNIVAFVGDGVNDAPALRKANVGISMGITGTDVSKESSSIILLDDNYQTIVNSIKRGRGIYDNIQNVILYLISGNIAGLIMVIFTSIFDLPVPFAPVHLLFINLINDSLPAIGIGVDDNYGEANLNPRKANMRILNFNSSFKMLFQGFVISFVTIIAFLIGYQTDIFVARTMAFSTLAMSRLFHSFNCRGNISIFNNVSYNRVLFYATIIGVILINLLLFVPFLQQIFLVSKLNDFQVILIYFLSFLPTAFLQIIIIIKKIIKKLINKN